MKFLVVGVLAVLAGAALVDAHLDLEVKVKDHLHRFSELRFPYNSSLENWTSAREYIEDRFYHIGLSIEKHVFNTTVATVEGDITVEGVNVIGIAEAGNVTDGVIVVIADYDSSTRTKPGPLFNNGAGITALLETARLFNFNSKWSGAFKLTKTTIFVAMDLNTKDHILGPGKPGGWFFVNEWLWDYLNQTDTNFGGAFVLDSILNFNDKPDVQKTGESFRLLFPENYENIREDGNKGNFICTLSLPGEKSEKLKAQFVGNYRKDRRRRPFRLEDMTLPEDTNMNQLSNELSAQDSAHFWSFTYNNEPRPLPAILITDTEQLRDNPCSRDCTCSSSNTCPVLTEEREEFLTATITALTNTLLRRQGERLPEPKDNGSSVASMPSLLTTVLVLLLGKLYQ